MSRRCQICGKGPVAGRVITQRGLAKKAGGVGKRTTGVSNRKFYPNLKNIRALINGSVRTIKACVRCIKHNKLTKAA